MAANILSIAEYLGRPWVIVLFISLLAVNISTKLTRLYGAVASMQDNLRKQGAQAKVRLAKQLAEVERLALSEADKALVRSLLLRQHGADQPQATTADTSTIATPKTLAKQSAHNLFLFGTVSLMVWLAFGATILSYRRAGYSISFDLPYIDMEKTMPGGGSIETNIDPGGYFVAILVGFAAIKAVENLFPVVRQWPGMTFAMVIGAGLPFIWGSFTAQS